MIKDIIANLSVTENGGVVGDYAVSVAAALQAHLTGVAFIYDPIVPTSVGRYNPAEIIETQRAANEMAAESAIRSFTVAGNGAGILFEPLTLSASLAGAAYRFARAARRFDLTIVGQPEMSRMEWIIGRNHAIRIWAANAYSALHPEATVQNRQCDDLLGRQPRSGARCF